MAELRKSHLEEIGVRIQRKREALGLRQEDLAELLNLRRESYNYIENGKRDLKTSEILALSEALGVSCDYILTGIANENKTLNEDLGLSQEAIENLKESKKKFPFLINAINFVLGSAQGLQVLYEIYQFLTIDFRNVFFANKKGGDFMQAKDFLLFAKAKKEENKFLPMYTFVKSSTVKAYFLERIKVSISLWDMDIIENQEEKRLTINLFEPYYVANNEND